MKTVLIKMEDELHRGLKVEAARRGKSMREVIVVGLGMWLEEWGIEKKMGELEVKPKVLERMERLGHAEEG